MTEQQFIAKQGKVWTQLELYQKRLKKLKKGPEKEQIAIAFLSAYREVGGDLAYANTHFPNSKTSKYLNQLLGNCHGLLYEKQGLSAKQWLKAFFVHFPERVKKEYKAVLLGCFFFLIGAGIAVTLLLIDERHAAYFLPGDIVETIKSHKMGPQAWSYPMMSAYIMTNNILVSLRAFVFGIFLGMGTIYVLFQNGAMLGALTFLVYKYADPWQYWALILPHGVLELTAIFIAGGAGLVLARGILLPRAYLRRHAIVREAKNAMGLIGGVVVLLIMAGLIEGFITPLDIPLWSSYAVAGATLTFLLFLFRKVKM